MLRSKTKMFSIIIAGILILPNLLLVSFAQSTDNKITEFQCQFGSTLETKTNYETLFKNFAKDATSGGVSNVFKLLTGTKLVSTALNSGKTIAASQDPVACSRPATGNSRDGCNIGQGEQAALDDNGNWKCFTPPAKITRGIIKIQPYKSIIPIPCQNIPGISNVNCAESYSAPGSYVLRIYQFALLLVGMAAFGQIVFGGLEYILAAGSFAKIDSAKKRIWDALSGLLLLLGAYFVLFNINPDLVSLRDPILKTIDTRKLAEQATQNLVDSANSFTGGGSSSSGGTLCRRTVNYGVTINTNIKFEGIQFMNDDKTVTQVADPKEIPQIPQSSCFECQPNSSKDSSGVCQCNSGYTQEGNQCLLPKF